MSAQFGKRAARRGALLVLVGAWLLALPAYAATRSWTGSSGADWSLSSGDTNWDGGLAWDNSGNSAVFGPAQATVNVNDSSGPVSVFSISFSGALGHAIGGDPLTMTGGPITANVHAAINAPITGSGGLTKKGLGTLTLGGANTFIGGVSIDAGTIRLGSAMSLGANAVTVASAAALDLGGFSPANGNALSLSGQCDDAVGSLTNSGSPATYAGLVTIAGGGASIGGSGDITLSAPLVATPNPLTKVGAGVLALTADSKRSGATIISGGTLRLQSAGALGPASAITLAGGSLDLRQPAGTVGGTVFGPCNTAITSSSSIIISRTNNPDAGTSHTLGTLAIGSQTLTLSSGANLNPGTPFGLSFGATTLGGDPIFDVRNNGSGTGTLTLGPLSDGGIARTLTKNGPGTLALGSAASGLVNGTLWQIAGGTLAAQAAGALSSAASTNQTQVVVGVSGILKGTVANAFASSPGGGPSVPIVLQGGTLVIASTSAITTKGDLAYSSGTVLLDRISSGANNTQTMGALTIGTATFQPAAQNYSFAPTLAFAGATTITGTPTFDTSNVYIALNGPLSGGSLIKTGAGTLTISGAQSHTAGATLTVGTTVATGGTLDLNSDAGPSGEKPVLSINSGRVNLGASQHLSDLAIAGGVLNVADKSLVLKQHAGGAGSFAGTYQGLTGLLASGAITSIVVPADANKRVGISTGQDALDHGNTAGFHGDAIAPADILIQYGWTGDVNMDGAISYLDYGVIDNAFLHRATVAPRYAAGDLNLDGAINYLDYGMIDNAFLAQNAPHTASASAVPEPALLALVPLAALSLRGRRR